MRKFHLRKYCYLVLWLALFAAVAGVWLFGQEPPPAVGQESAASPENPSEAPEEPSDNSPQ